MESVYFSSPAVDPCAWSYCIKDEAATLDAGSLWTTLVDPVFAAPTCRDDEMPTLDVDPLALAQAFQLDAVPRAAPLSSSGAALPSLSFPDHALAAFRAAHDAYSTSSDVTVSRSSRKLAPSSARAVRLDAEAMRLSSPASSDAALSSLSFSDDELAAFRAVHSVYDTSSAETAVPAASRKRTNKAPRARKAGRCAAPSPPIAPAHVAPAPALAAVTTDADSSAVCNVLASMGKASVAELTDDERVLYRRLKNREASQMSRDRKRQKLEVLAREVSDQKRRNKAVERERDLALKAVAALKAELAELKAHYCAI